MNANSEDGFDMLMLDLVHATKAQIFLFSLSVKVSEMIAALNYAQAQL